MSEIQPPDIRPISVTVDVCAGRYFVHWGLDNPPRLNYLEFSDAPAMVAFAIQLAAKSGINVNGLRRVDDGERECLELG